MNRVSVTFGTLFVVRKINIPVDSCISDIRLWNCCIHSACRYPTVANRELDPKMNRIFILPVVIFVSRCVLFHN